MRILGIDPGSRVTGYGVIAARGHEIGFVACGTIRTGEESDFSRRLLTIFEDLCEVISLHQPSVAAVEDMFVDRNPRSALKLGHARGAAVVAALHNKLTVFDYPARKVKQAVAGYGQAEKGQVQHMVRTLLQLDATPSKDAADALAVAICHAHHAAFNRGGGG
ncbi:crossover junction endodeoxyribonuclease RuvC [Desulfobulbus propionicus DSM 2032]|jgi:crossover junction endodeoxyribonuclease RuvC|uniref:Crossover junction endodeoxyribonuclease RuvC n=1 Tax=Desulfobulbus propionicus (strain ATCC 33891 / DSM 2032 / VKM B-1956 / 1pr3) TaxID=577650 RepID=A0A7U3YK34_DESPD|nr:crossover junction endodeoxyribonuclease RuvC [Desulfobulbus propionicus]ADW16850.1 crossover junction endodeoxyribonuclease RuvC [Desulfobulbus propionicus DSM 2032]